MKALHKNSTSRRPRSCAVLPAAALLFAASAAAADEPVAQGSPPSGPVLAVQVQDAPEEPSRPPDAPSVPAPLPAASAPITRLPSTAPRPIFTPEPAPALPAHRNNAMRIAGITITALGMLGAATGTVFAILSTACPTGPEDICQPVVLGFSGLILAPSLGLSAIGAPLWAVGTLPPNEPAPPTSSPWVPRTIAVGPGTAALEWSF